MLIGYPRVSTDNQDTAAQVAALEANGCERIFREKASGGRWERPQFLRLLNQLRSGDVVVVWKLDRLSRSLRDVLTIMEQRGETGAGFRSLTKAIDTTTPTGRMMMQMVRAFAEFERALSGAVALPSRIAQFTDVKSDRLSSRGQLWRCERHQT